jgi:ADP-dependent NAD(P)H-hydrate dehydratase
MSLEPPLRLSGRHDDAHKGDFGRVCLIGGSRGMSGSIAMSAMAALHAGAGLVTAAVPDRCLETVASFHPAVMTIALPDDPEGRFSVDAAAELSQHVGGSNAIGCGPGMTTEMGSVRIVERLLSMTRIPRVFDADAINAITADDMLSGIADAGPIILTPHPGELQRLTGVSAVDRPGQIQAASQLADQHGMIVVVKGAPTVVVGDGQTWTNTTGNPGMATAGSGDVLTGVVSAFLAQGLAAGEAAKLGVWVHGRAGDLAAGQRGQPGMTAVEILHAIGTAILDVTE